MSSEAISPFRFRSLPSEIRNKIYRILLCDFAPPLPDDVRLSSYVEMEQARIARHTIETAILLTNKATYREAYHVMVKTNRFVRVESVRGLPLLSLMEPMRMPIVSVERHIVERFKGYVLTVHVGTTSRLQPEEDSPYEASSLMMLHRDMDRFCKGLQDGDLHVSGFSQTLRLSIMMAPVIYSVQRIEFAPDFDGCFSVGTQELLLAPFGTLLRGYKTVKINGHVDQILARNVCKDIAGDQWSDTQAVVEEARTAKDRGVHLYRAGRFDDACTCWLDAAAVITQVVESTSWPNLVRSGDKDFVPTLAEVSFLMRLNIIQKQITDMQAPGWNSIQVLGFAAVTLAQDALHMAHLSLARDYWKKGYKYDPSPKHKAKLFYRHAFFLRLQAEPGTAQNAFRYIQMASQLQPEDAAIAEEKVKVRAWVQRSQ